MAKIVLENANLESTYKTAIVDFGSGYSTFQDNQRIKNESLKSLAEFTHPLLLEQILPKIGDYYYYTYDDLNGFLQLPKRIYATLLHVDRPMECQFKIKPSEIYLQLKADYHIYFSISFKQKALECIHIKQFNEYISNVKQFIFQYQDKVSLDAILTIDNLAETMDASLLYQSNVHVEQFCLQRDSLELFEVRYINQVVGFGVFAREKIKKNSVITHYCGVLVPTNIVNKSCAYTMTPKGLNLHLDARQYGNISRFINHAPQTTCRYQRKLQSKIATANIDVDYVYSQGHYFVEFRACRDIEIGEQLLSNYGEYYDASPQLVLFENNGRAMSISGKIINDTPAQRLSVLSLMNHPRVNRAQWLVIRRPVMVFLIMLFCSVVLKYH